MSARYKNVLEEMLLKKRNYQEKLDMAYRAGNIGEVRRIVYDHVMNLNN